MRKEAPFFSICIPAHNSLPLIEDAFSSIASQRFSNWEVVLVDDCSTDDIEYWVHVQKIIPNERLIYIRLEANKGPFYARRRAFRAAHGEYIMCIDSDDSLVGFDALGKLHQTILSANDCPDVVLYNGTIDLQIKQPWIDYSAVGMKDGIVSKERIVYSFLSTHWLNNLSTKAIKREVLLPANLEGFEGLFMCEDRLEVAFVISKANRFLLFDDQLYFYRQNIASTTHRLFDLEYCRQQSFVEASICKLFSRNPNLSAEHRQFLLLWSDDMLRIAQGRNLKDVSDCYSYIREDSFFQDTYRSEGLRGQRFDRALLLRLLWGRSYFSASMFAKLINCFKAFLSHIAD